MSWARAESDVKRLETGEVSGLYFVYYDSFAVHTHEGKSSLCILIDRCAKINMPYFRLNIITVYRLINWTIG